jgi:hypothetical protein
MAQAAQYPFQMTARRIARKLVVLVLSLALTAGVAPTARAAMDGCDMAMGAMDRPASLSHDQQTLPLEKQPAPCNDRGGCCTAACAGASALPQVGYSPMLAVQPAVAGWSVQAGLAGPRVRPELPPPIAAL